MRLSPMLCCLAAVVLSGCHGSVPRLRGVPEQGIAAVIVGGRFITPTGETRTGRMVVNFDGEGGRRAEVYRIPIRARQTLLYQVEPGKYRLSPTRNIFGFYQSLLKVRVEGETYRLPFPRDILRKDQFDIKPKKIVAIGVFEVKVSPALPGQKPTVKVRIDDTIEARRKIVQDIIKEMMDPSVPRDSRESAISWSRALQNALLDLLSETPRDPLYKSAP